MKELDGIRWRSPGTVRGDTSRRLVHGPPYPGGASGPADLRLVPGPNAAACSAALLYGEEYGIWGGLDPEQRLVLDARLQRGETLRVRRALGDRGARDEGSR